MRPDFAPRCENCETLQLGGKVSNTRTSQARDQLPSILVLTLWTLTVGSFEAGFLLLFVFARPRRAAPGTALASPPARGE